jgi:hypothetical protein
MVALVDVDLLVSKGIRERLKNPKKLQNLREQAREGWWYLFGPGVFTCWWRKSQVLGGGL